MSDFVNPPVPMVDQRPTEGNRTYAMITHLSGFLSYLIGPFAIIVTLALWLARRNESGFIDDHGREALNYNISIWLYALAASILMVVCIGYLILPALIIFDIVIMIVAAVRANGGGYYRYPITIRFIAA